MLDLDDQHPRVRRAGPVLIELVREFLLDAVVTREVEALGIVGFEIRIGRRLAEAAEGVREMAVIDHERIARIRMRVEAVGQKDVRAQVHVTTPELREFLAAHADVLDVLRVLGRRDGRNFLVESDRHHAPPGGVDRDLLRGRIEVPRRALPMLALAAIHWQFHHVPIGALERLVLMKHGLNAVRARWDLFHRLNGIAEHEGVEGRLVAGLPVIHVDAEHLLGVQARVGNLKPGLGGVVL